MRNAIRRSKPRRKLDYQRLRQFCHVERLESRSLLAVTTWTGEAGSFAFADAGNWDSGVPGIDDYAILNSSSQIQLDGVHWVSRLYVQGEHNLIDLNGWSLSIGPSGVDSLQIGTILDAAAGPH